MQKQGGRKLKIAVIGAGVSGVMAVIRLREIGQSDVVLFEKASEMGGTWRDNRYPGVACDVPSHLYRLSFEPNAEWSRIYSPGREIRAYLQDVYARHGIAGQTIFDAEVMKADYSDGRWTLETRAGTFGPFDVVITAMGILRYPLYPAIDGLESFAGITMHSADWDEALDLSDKRVGLIGCGSTGVQMTTAMAPAVQALSLFQRTAQWILASPNGEIGEEEKEGYRRTPALMQQRYAYLAGEFNSRYAAAVVGDNPEAYARMVQACEQNLESSVRDPALREKLRPDYQVGCRRLVISDGFYEAVQRPNVALVTDAIARIEPEGIRTADGRLHEIDLLALATGYDAHAGLSPMKITGRNGADLDTAWHEAQRAYLGMCVPDFPNFFMIGGPSSPIGNFSFLMTAETQMGYIAELVKRIAAADRVEIHPRPEAMDKLYDDIARRMPQTIWATGCKSWYMDRNGQIALWPWSYERFQERLRVPDMADFHPVPHTDSALPYR